ncbi:MAG: hypothetical protein ACI9LM_005101 [Alteromonadaceae bacterium]|jgi:hypothetical protein
MSSGSTFALKGFFIKLIAIFIGLYLLIWVVSSPAIKYFATPPLAELGLTLSDDSSISFNPFLMKLTIKDLALLKDQTKVAAVKRLEAQLALHKLIVDKIELQKFVIDGLFIKVEQVNDALTVAGVVLPAADKETEDPTVEPSKTEQPSEFTYKIILPELVVTNSTLAISIDNNDHDIVLNELLVTDVSATTQQQSAKVALAALIDQASLSLDADANFNQGSGTIDSNLSLSEYPLAKLQHFIKPLKQLSGHFSLNTKQQLSISPEKIQLSLNKAEISNTNLIAGDGFYIVKLQDLNNQINDFSLNLQNNAIAAIEGRAQLKLSGARLLSETDQQELLSFAQLSLQDISMQMSPATEQTNLQQPQVNIAMLTLDTLLTSKNHDLELPPLATIKQVSISNIAASAQGLMIDEINIDSLNSDIILNKEKLIANLVAFSAKSESAVNDDVVNEEKAASQDSVKTEQTLASTAVIPSDDATTTPQSEANFQISLHAFNVINNNQINFVDNSVDPVYKRVVYLDKIYLGALSNNQDAQENETPIELIGRSNEYAKFNFSGFIKPFAKAKTYHIKGGLSELSLPAVSTYMKDALQLELKSGQLNTDVDLTLIGDNIDGDVNFIVNGLDTTAANNDAVNMVKDQVSMPLNIALGMLMDGDGNLELGVPLSGKTSDPSFGLSSFIALITKKAAMSAAESYVMKTFVPYANIVSVAKSAGEFLLKVRFEDLPYEIKQVDPNGTQQVYLDQFIALMQDKTDTQVKLCAISVPQDIGLADGIEIKDKDKIKQLKSLGEQREQAFKAYVIKHGTINSARMLLCSPKIDSSKDAKPRMVISV